MGLPTVPANRSPYNPLAFSLITWTVAAESANVIKVTGRVKNARNQSIGARTPLRVYLTQDATNRVIAPVAPATSVAIAAKGAILVTVTSKLFFEIITDVNGEFDLNITDTTAGTWYVVAIMPDGTTSISGAVTFAQPAVVSLSPTGGTTAGGTALTITGTGFEAGSTVDIGGAAATSVVVVSATSITCVTPARTSGAKAVTVTSPHGVSNTNITYLYA